MKKITIMTAVAAFLILSLPRNTSADQLNTAEIMSEDVQYVEIESSELPQAVNDVITKDYAEYTVDKAYKGNDGTYKTVLSKTGDKLIVVFNEKGEVVKTEDSSDTM